MLATGLLSAYQISVGMDGKELQTIWFYTVGFGTLLVAGLLLIILGFEGLESQAVGIISISQPFPKGNSHYSASLVVFNDRCFCGWFFNDLISVLKPATAISYRSNPTHIDYVVTLPVSFPRVLLVS